MNAFTTKEYTCYYARVLDADLPLAVDVLCDMVASSLIAAGDVESERGVILEEIAMHDDDPADAVHDVFAQAAVGRHPARPADPRHGRVDQRTDPPAGRRLLPPALPPARDLWSRCGQRRPPGASYAS